MSHTIRDQRSCWRGCAALRGRPKRWSARWKAAVSVPAILQQIAAVRGAVNGLMAQVLEGACARTLICCGRHAAAA